jgi:hypothetical protein
MLQHLLRSLYRCCLISCQSPSLLLLMAPPIPRRRYLSRHRSIPSIAHTVSPLGVPQPHALDLCPCLFSACSSRLTWSICPCSDILDRDSTPHHVYMFQLSVHSSVCCFKYLNITRAGTTGPITFSRITPARPLFPLVRDRCCSPLLIYDCLIWVRLCTSYLALSLRFLFIWSQSI